MACDAALLDILHPPFHLSISKLALGHRGGQEPWAGDRPTLAFEVHRWSEESTPP